MTEPSYILRKPTCGCIVAIMADDDDKRSVAKFVAKGVRDGYEVERIESQSFRDGSAGKFTCRCGVKS